MLERLPPDYYKDSVPLDCRSSVVKFHDISSGDIKNYIGSVVWVNITLSAHQIGNRNDPKHYYYEFEFDGLEWLLSIFPDGVNKETQNTASIFLISKFGSSDITRSVDFTFDYGNEGINHFTFSCSANSCGFVNWKKRNWANGLQIKFVLFYTKETDFSFGNRYYAERENIVVSTSCRSADTVSDQNKKFNNDMLLDKPGMSAHSILEVIHCLTSKGFVIDKEFASSLAQIFISYHLEDLKIICEFVLYCDCTFEDLINDNLGIPSLCFKHTMPFLQARCIQLIKQDFKRFIRSNHWSRLFADKTCASNFTSCFAENATFVKRQNDSSQKDLISGSAFATFNEKEIYWLDADGSSCRGATIIFKVTIDDVNVTSGSVLFHDFLTHHSKWRLVVDLSTPIITVYLINNSLNDSEEIVDAYFCFTVLSNKLHYHCFSKNSNKAIIKREMNKKETRFTFILMSFSRDDSNNNRVNHHLVYKQFDHVKLTNMMCDKPREITLCGEDWSYPVNKEVLKASSPVFNAMFSHEFKENIKNTVTFNNISSETMKMIISFLYTGRTSVNRETALEMCSFADKYDMALLKTACEHACCFLLDKETVVDYITTAKLYNMHILKRKCLYLIGDTFKTFVLTDGWADLTADPNSTREIFEELSKLCYFGYKLI